MKRSAPPVGQQGNLPLVDTPSLEIPRQQELALALMDLLVQVNRQVLMASNTATEEVPDGKQDKF